MASRGLIKNLCISKERGVVKNHVAHAEFLAGLGVKNDAHAGPHHRQVSLLSEDDIEAFRRKCPVDLQPGAFGENVIISDMDFSDMGLGSEIQLGEQVRLSITQIGKQCHSRCPIFFQTGDCIMPKVGMFARVIKGGAASAGESVKLIKRIPRSLFQCVVITVSDRCSRKEAEDTAGPAVSELLQKKLDAHIYMNCVIPDEKEEIAERLRHYCDGHSIDLVVTVGGTGFSPRDITPEATMEVVDRLTPGLNEAMRQASLVKTPFAMLSRGISGIRRSTLIINVPGAERAACENVEAILPALHHGLSKMKGDPSDCGGKDSPPV
ncbi:MAG: MOSC domain-containing protein [Candidatus Omnitrophica bacterium]|nr:MOSC domain-containing protein [Candidatus Omnitrophota bacterium]